MPHCYMHGYVNGIIKWSKVCSKYSCLFSPLSKNQTGWAELLYRFVKGGGSIYDIEFMTDDSGEI